MKKQLQIPGLIVVLLMLAIACNKDKKKTPEPAGLDRKPMLENYASNYVLPAYADMEQQLINLKAKTDAFTTAPNSSNHQALRQAWLTAYTTWQKVDLLEFGPAEQIGLRAHMNIYPVTKSKIDNNIASGNYNLDEFGNRDAQGFPALDYLVNGTDPESYNSGSGATGKKAYLQAVVAKMLEKTTAVKNAWDTYKTTFVNATGTDVNSSLSQMVNAYVLYYERYLRSGKIGLPVGAMTGVAKADLVEGYYDKVSSKDLAITAMTSVINFYSGKHYNGSGSGESMQSYLAAVGTKDENGGLMADLVVTEMNGAVNALSSLDNILYNDMTANRTKVLGVYEELQDVVPLLKVDMVSAFSISITYTDNDGD